MALVRADAKITLILGGARSGKSRLAEELAQKHDGRLVYIATAEAWDDEMRARIAEHKARRGDRWHDIEAPIAIAEILRALPADTGAVLVDCLTLWLSNLMHANRDIAVETANLLAALDAVRFPVLLVSNEVGLGIVPENKLARDFRDHQGRLNQAIAAQADHAVFMSAGLSLVLK
ncbi:bifunctional adenosylcobinamide kinase/adenosylcobinamide-phosphate guanylyltransferase [Ferrovibrio sp.]|uniref:bifunctional adenosylcobinamide kinase/adenosylcobinamide-phosphate guanylyltransferase n=1 Tax=Ferrovibrio sp. TaxID=1917215 RepID=UPI00261F0935|nr:bifunctional adenosylcobinamide kinase/adenosylcobinamide-phosphate guanylyltransferase [Ferrovibrio sp.]